MTTTKQDKFNQLSYIQIKVSKLIEGWRKRNLFASTALPEESEFLTSDVSG